LVLHEEEVIDNSSQHTSRKLTPKILELNNNPAMPSPGKRMSALYQEHLISFVQSITLLGLRCSRAKLDNYDDIACASEATLGELGFRQVW